MSPVRAVFSGLFFVSTFAATMSAVLLLRAPREGDRAGAWFWAAAYASSSLVAALSFGELL